MSSFKMGDSKYSGAGADWTQLLTDPALVSHLGELLQVYRKAVISGFADVENALDDIRKTAERERLQRDVVTSSQRAFDISEQRLREGTVDLVTVLQTQQTLYAAQDALVQARLAHVQAIVSLYQALGGGWHPKPVVTADAR